MITSLQADILGHTIRTGRYCSNEPACIELGAMELLHDYGPQELAGGAHYLVMTHAGHAAFREWQAVQPKPKPIKRRCTSPAFESWRNFCDACGHMPFGEFLKGPWKDERLYR